MLRRHRRRLFDEKSMTAPPTLPSKIGESSDSCEDVLKKLKRVESQLRGVQQLVRQNADCEKVVQRFAGVRKLLDSTAAPLAIYLLGKEMQSRLVTEQSGSAHVAETLSSLQALLSHRG
jgi:DNA-binding FrmR family transcriptional regulator